MTVVKQKHAINSNIFCFMLQSHEITHQCLYIPLLFRKKQKECAFFRLLYVLLQTEGLVFILKDVFRTYIN